MYFIAAFIGVFLTVVAQLFLKKGALSNKGFVMKLMSPFSIIGYGLFVLVTLLNLFALTQLPLKYYAFIAPLNFILVPIGSRIFYNEKLTKRVVQSIIIIVIGVLLFNLDLVL